MKYKDWKEEFYSSLVENNKMFVCCLCMIRIKHPFILVNSIKYLKGD